MSAWLVPLVVVVVGLVPLTLLLADRKTDDLCRVSVDGDRLRVSFGGRYVLATLVRPFAVPLSTVRAVAVGRGDRSTLQGLRVGTGFPGVLYAGRWLRLGGRDFVLVRPGSSALVVDLEGARFLRLLVHTADDEAARRAIADATAAR